MKTGRVLQGDYWNRENGFICFFGNRFVHWSSMDNGLLLLLLLFGGETVVAC